MQNMPSFSTFLITSCGNKGSDDLGRDIMTENQILSQAELMKMFVCYKHQGELRCRSWH